jgi:hypothetical protein
MCLFLSEAVESASAHHPLMNRKPSSMGIVKESPRPSNPISLVCLLFLSEAVDFYKEGFVGFQFIVPSLLTTRNVLTSDLFFMTIEKSVIK